MTTITTALEVAQEVNARILAISKANGYLTDVGLNVMRGRRRIDDNQVPCSVIVEGDDHVTPSPGRIPSAEVRQSYVIAAYSECSANHPNDRAHEIIKDIKRALFHDGVTFGGKVPRVEYKGRDIGPRSDGVAIVCASVEIEVKFVEDLTNP
jgi:hypothetical protein